MLGRAVAVPRGEGVVDMVGNCADVMSESGS